MNVLKLCVYIPEKYLETVKAACFDAGAGRLGAYTCCSWEVAGTGQFLPGDHADPAIGRRGRVERVEEFRVEMLVPGDRARAVIDALVAAHPYEEPAYDLVQVLRRDDLS
jgi:structural toxin protein (hemagglutinin/hemolysin) RtxA